MRSHELDSSVVAMHSMSIWILTVGIAFVAYGGHRGRTPTSKDARNWRRAGI